VVVPQPPPTPAKPKKVKPGATPVPVMPVTLPADATKEQRLAELLRRYRGDEITPEDYHKQRAAILAEP
jgi:hypothetical protein